MKGKLIFLHLIRLIILILSLATLGCHVAQLVLLSQIPNTGSWWPNYVPYTLYYVASIVSILSATFLLIFGCFLSKSLASDRIVSLINVALFIAVAVYNSLESGTIPWTGSALNPYSSSVKGYASYCSNYSEFLLSSRCWLTNGTWLGILIVGFFWLILALYTTILKSSEIYDEDYDTYDFKEDVPMASTHHKQPLMNRSSIHSAGPTPPPHQYTNAYMMSSGTPQSPPFSHQDNYYYPPYDTSPTSENNYFPAKGYQRPRKVSKTYLEEDNVAPLEDLERQPPHSK